MLQRGLWLVGVAGVVACSGARETGGADAGGSTGADAAGGGGVDAFWPASTCPGAMDVANVGVVTQQHVNFPRLVRAGARTGIVWTGTTATNWEAKFAWLDDAMQVVPGTTVIVSPDDGVFSSFTRAAWSGSEIGVVYSDDRHGDQHRGVYFARLDGSGALIAGSEVELGTADQNLDWPAVAWDPIHAQWGVAWQQLGDGPSTTRLWFARLDAHGALIATISLDPDPAGTGGFATEAGPSPLVWTGSRWALTWRQQSSLMISEIPALGGAVHDITIPEPWSGFDSTVAIGSDGTRYMLGWVRWQNSAYRLDVSLVDENGLVPGTLTTLGATLDYSGEASIGWSGSQFAVAYRGAAPNMDQVRLAMFDAAGALGSDRALTCDTQLNAYAEVSWHGAELDIPYAAQDPSGYSEIDRPEVNDLRVLRVPAVQSVR